MDIQTRHHNNSSKVAAGLIFITIGAAFLLRDTDFLPRWVLSWSMLVLAVGLIAGYKSNFRYGGWLVPVGIGLIFTVSKALSADYDFSNHLIPAILIFLGLYSLLKPTNYRPYRTKAEKRQRKSAAAQAAAGPVSADATYVFTSEHRQVYDKAFQGGNLSAVFGGGELDLSQADFDSVAVLNLTAVFGGIKIYIPEHWELKPEITCIFGGVADKRKTSGLSGDAQKVLVLRGTAFFGGVEIRSRKPVATEEAAG